MAIDFASLISDEQKRSILEQRQAQFAAEAWQHELNRQTAVAIGDTVAETAASEALATLETALTVNADELAKLP